MTTYFNDDDEIRSLVKAFENCEIHPEEFRHYQHLAVALWYVAHLPFAEAATRLRGGIQKLAAAHGKDGYHETITVFWLTMVGTFFGAAKTGSALCELANELAQNYGHKNFIGEYYSQALLATDEARRGWVPGDLKELPPYNG